MRLRLRQIGFWPVADTQLTPTLWEDLRQAILTEFNGLTQPRVGFGWRTSVPAGLHPDQIPPPANP